MELLSDWKAVLKEAWSMKLMGFSAFLEIAREVVPYVSDFIPWWATVIVIVVAMLARLIKQPEKADGE